jgi:hypothetical protein
MSKRFVVSCFLLANLLFWVYFWVDFGLRAERYVPHPPAFEEILPFLVVAGLAIPTVEPIQYEWNWRALRLAVMIHLPAFSATQPLIWIGNWLELRHEEEPGELGFWDKTFLGTSMGGYRLILVMLLSFLQWYLIAILLAWFVTRFRRATP